MKLLRLWCCAESSIARVEYATNAGHVEQCIADIHEPDWQTEWRPSASNCPDELADDIADLAFEVISNANSHDRRWAGWDLTEDAAIEAFGAWYAGVMNQPVACADGSSS